MRQLPRNRKAKHYCATPHQIIRHSYSVKTDHNEQRNPFIHSTRAEPSIPTPSQPNGAQGGKNRAKRYISKLPRKMLKKTRHDAKQKEVGVSWLARRKCKRP